MFGIKNQFACPFSFCEEKMTEMINDLEAKRGEKISPYQTIYYDNLNTMLMDLDARRRN